MRGPITTIIFLTHLTALQLGQIASEIPLNDSFDSNQENIVACQRGGVSDEPSWFRAATRHGAGTL